MPVVVLLTMCPHLRAKTMALHLRREMAAILEACLGKELAWT